jgi:hypothetical protein
MLGSFRTQVAQEDLRDLSPTLKWVKSLLLLVKRAQLA